MQVTIFGATGSLGRECLDQCLEAGHRVTVLARDPAKLPEAVRTRVQVVAGDALDPEAVARALPDGTQGILFALGIDRASPEDLCTDATRHILARMPALGPCRFVWCGGGSTLVPRDTVTFGARFVEWFARTFMALRHRDKEHQLELLERNREVAWLGIRPLQMVSGPRRGTYRLGYDRFSGFSRIHFADCADAMLGMLHDDTWLHEAPVVQY
ncbi:MAG: NAD(P)-dependent oxidoreductase [Myxococcota bacterium]